MIGILESKPVVFATVRSGYAYKLDFGDSPTRYEAMTTADDNWDTVIVGTIPGERVGMRLIDGSKCLVIEGEPGEFYAQVAHE